MRTPRITHLVGAELGGAEKQLAALLRERDPRFDHQVLVVRDGPLVTTFAELVPTTVLGKTAGVDLRFFGRLVRALRRSRPDIVHAWTETPALWAPTAAKLAGVPHVVLAEVALQEWKKGPHLLADRVNYKLVSRVVGNAAAVVDSAVRRGADRAKTQVILLGVDVPADPVLDRDSRTVLLLARFDYRKGHTVLVRAMPKVLAAVPDARFTLAGPAALDEEKEVLAEVTSLIQSLGLGAAVDLPGRVDPGPLLRSAAVLAVPSTSEGMPNVVLEAMAQGLPVVASQVGGIPEVLADGASGWLVPAGDSDALADALIEALSRPDTARARAVEARKVAENLDMVSSMRRWERLYDALVEDPKS